MYPVPCRTKVTYWGRNYRSVKVNSTGPCGGTFQFSSSLDRPKLFRWNWSKFGAAGLRFQAGLQFFTSAKNLVRANCDNRILVWRISFAPDWAHLSIFLFIGEGGRCLHSTEEAFLLPNQLPRVRILAPSRFFSLLLSMWTVLILNPFSAKQLISQMQLHVAMTSRARNYKISLCLLLK